ncbi:MAG: HDOD domain-containing protein [Armatimonadetes bacterium]|nr:HDOD domain-containing protein [Armatimonadota bacterium]MDW8028356.1 HDOD domain-containing protein [Armatimonadota bacterium]
MGCAAPRYLYRFKDAATMRKQKILAITRDKEFLSSLIVASSRLNIEVQSFENVPSKELLEKPWHAVLVDIEGMEHDGVLTLSWVKSLSPLSLRCLVLSSLEPQLILKAINEAKVHHILLKPVFPKELESWLKEIGGKIGVQTFPFIFAAAVENKTGKNYGHGYRVAQYALAVGHQIRLSESQLNALQIGCLLHDTGKLLLPESLILTDEAEREGMHPASFQHSLFGEQIAKNLGLTKEVLGVIRHHHERWDGEGYPDRLKGEAIPLLARIAAVTNIYDHLTERNEGEKALTHSEINQLLESEAGFAFDPFVIKALMSLREKEDVTKVLEQIDQLPALAPLVQRALVLLERDDFDWQEVTDVISQDQNLAAQVLRLANSAMTGLRRKVTSLSTALKVLGARPIKNLLLTLSVRPLLQASANLRLWEHSLTCALVTKELAKRTQLIDPEEAFTAGLLHDIGKVVLARNFKQSYKRAIEIAQLQECPLFVAERLVFSISHAEVGAWLLERWRIPSTFCKAVAMHHDKVSETQTLAWHLCWANQIIHIALEDYPSNRWISTVGIAPKALHPLIVNSEQLVKSALNQAKSIEAFWS